MRCCLEPDLQKACKGLFILSKTKTSKHCTEDTGLSLFGMEDGNTILQGQRKLFLHKLHTLEWTLCRVSAFLQRRGSIWSCWEGRQSRNTHPTSDGDVGGNNPPDTPGGVEGLEEDSPRGPQGWPKALNPMSGISSPESQPWDSIVSVTARPS